MKIISPRNSFSNILEETKKRVDDMPEPKTKKLKESLEHGLAELKTEDEMDMYLSSYGTMHQEIERSTWMNLEPCFIHSIATTNLRSILTNGINHTVAKQGSLSAGIIDYPPQRITELKSFNS